MSPSDAEYPTPTKQPLASSKPATEEAALKLENSVKDDGDSWLSNVLSQKKSQAQEKMKEKKPGLSGPLRCGEEVDPIVLAK